MQCIFKQHGRKEEGHMLELYFQILFQLFFIKQLSLKITHSHYVYWV